MVLVWNDSAAYTVVVDSLLDKSVLSVMASSSSVTISGSRYEYWFPST